MPSYNHVYVCSIVYICKYCVCPHGPYNSLNFEIKNIFWYKHKPLCIIYCWYWGIRINWWCFLQIFLFEDFFWYICAICTVWDMCNLYCVRYVQFVLCEICAICTVWDMCNLYFVRYVQMQITEVFMFV